LPVLPGTARHQAGKTATSSETPNDNNRPVEFDHKALLKRTTT